jgi:rRNA maturation RNase YbeY
LPKTRAVREWILSIAALHNSTIENIGVVFCTDSFLLEMNRQYLSHDYFTDIITFDYSEDKRLAGELYISIDRVRENAKTMGIAFRDEVHRILVHGILHLIGFSDKSKPNRKQMQEQEDLALSLRSFV